MKNSFKRNNSNASRRRSSIRLGFGICAVFGIITVLSLQSISHAQRLYGPVRVSSISSQPSTSGTVVTITADNTLTRAQTWQDDEGYHLVLPNTVAGDAVKPARGVKIRRIGSSLEVLVQTKPGARVNAQSGHNELSLFVEGKLVARPTDSYFPVESTSTEERRLFEDVPYPRTQQETPSLKLSTTADDLAANSGSTDQNPAAPSAPTSEASAPPAQVTNQIVPQGDGSTPPEPPPSEIRVQGEDNSFLASVFSGTSVLIVLVLGLFGLLVSHKVRSKQQVSPKAKAVSETAGEQFENLEAPQQSDASKSLVKTGESLPPNGSSRQSVARMPVAGPTSLYGAYRIDQEVGKLVLGQPHRVDVLASRAVDDRRAIETSLIKAVNAPELDESARKRGREALEEYGFVARQCATLLLAPDAFERSTAARCLGEIKSSAALPFLLESLYDSEAIVRNQAVISIGELKLPSAIGALLDIARTHPEVPSGLLTRALSACSVEGLDFFDAMPIDTSLLGPGDVGAIVEEITQLEPASSVEELPDSCEDPRLAQALASVNSDDDEERSEALKALGEFRVRSAVEAVTEVARHDREPAIRSLAISTLASITHESVFPAILVGMADESREVRAAAARSLNRLNFDRADAYVRVIETGDEETIREVAKACIQAGIVSQNLDRLGNSDHRQAYETFSLICLLAKADMNEPVLDAICHHPRMDVRLKAVHLLACTGQPNTFEQLRELAVKDGISEAVKTALLEAMYKLDQSTPRPDEMPDVSNFHFNEFVGSEFFQENIAPVEPFVENGITAEDDVANELEIQQFEFQSSPATEADAETDNGPDVIEGYES